MIDMQSFYSIRKRRDIRNFGIAYISIKNIICKEGVDGKPQLGGTEPRKSTIEGRMKIVKKQRGIYGESKSPGFTVNRVSGNNW